VSASVGPSYLSQSALPPGFGDDDDDDEDNEMPVDDYAGPADDDDLAQSDDMDAPPSYGRVGRQAHAPTPPPRRHARFSQLAQEGVEDAVEDTVTMSYSKSKGKGRAVNGRQTQDLRDDEEVEDEIAQGMEELDMAPPMEDEDDEPEPEPEPEPPTRKKRQNTAQGKKRRKEATVLPGAFCSLAACHGTGYLRVRKDDDEEETEAGGLRRGKRTRYAPLEWWRCEKIVYGRRESGVSFVPTIKAIVRIPKEPPKPLGVHARRHWRKPKSNSKGVEDAVMVYNPEEGWDENTESFGIVRDWLTGEEVQRRAFCARQRVSSCVCVLTRCLQVWRSRRRW